MKTFLECIPCFVRQSLEVCHLVTQDRALQEKILRGVLGLLSEIRFDESPPHMATRIHRFIREMTGETDPYKRLKDMFNQVATNLYPQMKEKVKVSPNPFETAVRMAIAGNTIDCALVTELDLAQIHSSIATALSSSIDSDSMSRLASAVRSAERILYIGDNAGEIVFDRILVEEMPCDKVTFAVRGHPILNDATMEDAVATEVTDLVRVIDSGCDVPGTILEECSQSFRDCFNESDLIIAKGQGNYETLSGNGKSIFFLFKAKCPVVAHEIGCELDAPVVYRTNPQKKGGENHA